MLDGAVHAGAEAARAGQQDRHGGQNAVAVVARRLVVPGLVALGVAGMQVHDAFRLLGAGCRAGGAGGHSGRGAH